VFDGSVALGVISRSYLCCRIGEQGKLTGIRVISRSYLCCRIGEQGKLTGIKRSPISMTN